MSHLLAVGALLLTVCVPGPVRAQPEGSAVLADIRDALQEGDAERLMKQSGDRIDLTVFGVSELLSRSQARYVIRAFFAEYRPNSVRLIDTSESDGNWFAAARYSYERGTAPLSVYLRLRRASAGWELRELRFERTTAL